MIEPASRRRLLLRATGLAAARSVAGCVRAGTAAATALVGPSLARAQDWPSKPIRIVVPYVPGSLSDTAVRAIGQRMGERLGQPVLMEYKPGAAGNLGIEHVARSAPDGYTLLFGVTALAINPALGKVPYDPLRDLVPVVALFQYRPVLVVRAGLGVRSVEELLELSRRGPITCGSAGGQLAIACALLRSADREFVHVPYKGMAAARQDLQAGVLDAMFDTAENAGGSVSLQRAVVLGSTGPAYQHATLGTVASLSQVNPSLDLRSWVGLMAPAGTPAAVVARLHAQASAVLAEPEIARQLAGWGMDRTIMEQEQFAALVRRDVERYARIVREAGLRAE